MSVITNMQIVANEITIKNNHLPDGEFNVNPRFTRRTGKTDEGKYFTELSVEMFNTEENPFPVDLYANIVGLFELDNRPEDYIDIFLKINAVQILFPYLRAMVTNALTTAMMPPIVLPVINPETLFKN